MLSRRLSTADFGSFGVIYLFYTGAALVFVAATAEVNVALGSGVSALYQYQASVVRRALPVFAGVAFGSAWIVKVQGWPLAAAVFSVTLPWFVVHESLRALAASVGSIGALIWSDLVWLLALIAIVEVSGFLGRDLTPALVVVAWWVSGLLGTAVLASDAYRNAATSDVESTAVDLQRLGEQSTADRIRSAADYLVARLGVALATTSVGVFVGAGALGQTRYAQTYFGPLNLVIGGVRFVGLRALDLGKRLTGLAVALLGCWVVLTAAGVFAPIAWWQAAFGTSFVGWGWPFYAVAIARLGAALAVVPLLRARFDGRLAVIWNARVWATGLAFLLGLSLIWLRRPVGGVSSWLAAEPLLAVILLVIFQIEPARKDDRHEPNG